MILAILILMASHLPGLCLHHFYVSKTIMHYAPEKGTIEITVRFFTDDLERAVAAHSSTDFKITHGDNDEGTKVEAYIKQHFTTVVNGKPVVWNWIGMEAQADLTYCYMEYAIGESLRNLEISNDCLMELFPEQQNIVDFSALSTTQTAILVRGASHHSFSR